jgi:hypothetical protein
LPSSIAKKSPLKNKRGENVRFKNTADVISNLSLFYLKLLNLYSGLKQQHTVDIMPGALVLLY